MNPINFFQKLSSSELQLIFKWVGRDFSTLSRVCQLFYTVSAQEARRFYEMFELKGGYGAPCLRRAIEAIGYNGRSYVGKVDGLFFAAMRLAGISLDTRISYYEAGSLEALQKFMLPWQEADALFKLWNVLRRTGPTDLKEAMSKVGLKSNYSEKIKAFREFFEAHRSELNQVTHLDLSKNELRTLPPELWIYFTGLKKLDLNGNCLENLPKQIGVLSQLVDLRVNNNSLKLLPLEIGDLRSLKNLQCAFNDLKSVPDAICSLSNLATLNLCYNELEQLPENLGNLKSLNYLYLEYNNLKCLPSSIGKIDCLLGIYLTHNNLEILPESMCDLQSIKYLAIQSNGLEVLPENIGNMSSLYSLCVDYNEIVELPKSFAFLKNLKHFSFSNNSISSFPKGMSGLAKLALFHFDDNPIKNFPEELKELPFWSLNPQYYPHLKAGNLKKVLNIALSADDFDRVYWGLGENKWEECIDGADKHHGKEVYDRGLHGKVKEPGFLQSMMDAFDYLSDHYNEVIHASLYLEVQEKACGHFDGEKTNTLMRQEKIGMFRDLEDHLNASFTEPNYSVRDSAIEEFNYLSNRVSLFFGASFHLGDFVLKTESTREVVLRYAPLSIDQVAILFNFFSTEFYYEIGHAADDHGRITAIAKLIQRLEWLHPVPDGCGRTDTAFLNYLLTCYGFNPVLLKFPYVSSCMPLQEWAATVIEGMEAWRRRKQTIVD